MLDMRILIIEDDRDAAAYLAKAFREAGHIADQANDGVTGYDLALEGAYDVAIVDRMLPKMDGLTLVGALREQKITRRDERRRVARYSRAGTCGVIVAAHRGVPPVGCPLHRSCPDG